MEVGKIDDFRLKSPFISEMVPYRPCNVNRKSLADRSESVPMTLSDL